MVKRKKKIGNKEDSTMKKNIFSMAVLLIASAAVFTACSSDDNVTGEQPANPTAPKTYTMTIEATKSTGDAAATRGLSLDGKTLNVKWNEGEKVEVVQGSATLGTLTATPDSSDPTKATLSGTLTSSPADDQPILFALHGAQADYTGQKGILLKTDGDDSIEENYDYAACQVEKDKFTIDTDAKTVSVPDGITLISAQAIVKFSLYKSDGITPINATSLAISSSPSVFATVYKISTHYVENSITCGNIELTGLSGTTNDIYVALCTITSANAGITLTATDASGNTYTYTKSGVTFAIGQYYEVKVKMKKQATDLSMVDNAGNARSTMSTANCYMVHTAGDYKLPLVYGNAIKDGAANTDAYTGIENANTTLTFPNHAGKPITGPWIKNNKDESDNGITVVSAELLWQDAQGLVTAVGIDGDYLTLTVGKDATTQQGNAVVAVKDGSGNIVWSWHIWVTTETFATLTTVSTSSHNYQVTPVNLGWVPTGGEGKQGYNTYYQWGRKDAFIPGTWNAATNHTVYNISNTEVTGLTYTSSTTASTDATIADNIKNPTTHYKNSTYGPCNTTYYNMWDAQQTGTGNIATATKKTVYDPCPAGFCVPTNNLFNFMSNNGSSRTMTTWDDTNKGATWDNSVVSNSITGNALFFPASGFRSNSGGSLNEVGGYGFYWSASPDGDKYGHNLYFFSSYWSWYGNSRAYGFPVRAVAEE